MKEEVEMERVFEDIGKGAVCAGKILRREIVCCGGDEKERGDMKVKNRNWKHVEQT